MKSKHIVCQNQHGCQAEQARLGLVHLRHRSVVMQVRHALSINWALVSILPVEWP